MGVVLSSLCCPFKAKPPVELDAPPWKGGLKELVSVSDLLPSQSPALS